MQNGESSSNHDPSSTSAANPKTSSTSLPSLTSGHTRRSRSQNPPGSVSLTSSSVLDSESAVYCCAVVHDAARGLPDFLEYLADNHGSLTIKHGIIGHPRDMETTSMKNYQERVAESYASGTYRFGFLDNISLVGTVAEESGGFFPDILDMLDENPFLRMVSYFLSSQFTNFVVSFMMFYTSVNPMTNL